jgi:hypothetical protein
LIKRLLCVLLFIFVPRLAAQSCDTTQPYYYDITVSCESMPDGLCAPSTRVGISLRAWISWVLTSCATVEWDLGDGTLLTLNGSVPVVHEYPTAGRYEIEAKITTPGNPNYHTEHATVDVANGRLAWSDETVREGGIARIDVTRTNSAGATTLPWSVVDAPAELTPTSGSVSFAPGQQTATIEIATVGNSTFAPPRTYEVIAGAPTGGFLAPSAITLTVIDDDGSILSLLQPGEIQVSEDTGEATIVVNRSGDTSSPVAVWYSVDGFYPYRVQDTWGTLLFLAGETSRSFKVTVLDDAIWNAGQVARANMSFESRTESARFANGDYSYRTTLALVDNEPKPVISVADVSVLEGSSGATELVFTVSVAPAYPAHLNPLFLTPSIRPGTATRPADYIPLSGSFQLSGNGGNQIRVRIIGDKLIEDDETFELVLTSSSQAVLAMPPPARGTIVNDDWGFGPDGLRIPVGESRTAVLNVGSSRDTLLLVPLTNSRPDLAQIPASITIPAGQMTARFDVQGLAASASTFRISADLPADRGGTLTMSARVFAPRAITFDPATVTAFAGQTVPVRVTVDPPPGNPLDLQLEMINSTHATAPPHVTIGPDGRGTFEITAVRIGSALLRTSVPDDGHESASLPIEISAPPDAPALASVNPSTGSIAGGTEFHALGSHLTADCTLSFGGVPVSTTTLEEGALKGVTPPHAAGTVDVTLTCGGTPTILSNAFTYIAAPPALTAVSPSFGTTAGGTLVRAAGSNFQSGCWMFFAGVAAPAVDVDSTESLTAGVPASTAAGLVETSVRCGNLIAALPASFAYTTASEAAPSIASIAPLIGAPGESVSITGSRFRRDDRIRFDDATATILRTRSDEHVVRIPELPLGMTSITLTDATGRSTTTGPILMIVEPAPPQVTSVAPATTLPGSDVTLHGRGFRPAYSFTIGGQPAQVISLAFDRAVVRIARNVAPGSYRVHVVNAAGNVAAVGAQVAIGEAALRIRSVSPACGTTEGGAAVTLSGDGFALDAEVTFNGIPATGVVVVSPTELRATAPANSTGPAVVVVSNPSGDEAIASGAFRYYSRFDPKPICSDSSTRRSVRH